MTKRGPETPAAHSPAAHGTAPPGLRRAEEAALIRGSPSAGAHSPEPAPFKLRRAACRAGESRGGPPRPASSHPAAFAPRNETASRGGDRGNWPPTSLGSLSLFLAHQCSRVNPPRCPGQPADKAASLPRSSPLLVSSTLRFHFSIVTSL